MTNDPNVLESIHAAPRRSAPVRLHRLFDARIVLALACASTSCAAHTGALSIAEARIDVLTNAGGQPPADTIPDRIGQSVAIVGTVTSIDFRGSNGIEYFVEDTTAGIKLFDLTTNFGPFAIGDQIDVSGTITQFNGLTQIDPDSIALANSGPLPPAQPIDLVELGDGLGERIEGRLVLVPNATIAAGAIPAAGSGGVLTLSDGVFSATLRIDADTDIDGSATPAGSFSLVALVTQFDSSAPHSSGYELLPRSLSGFGPAESLYKDGFGP